MSDNPIGPLVGAAIGLAALGATVKITKDLLADSKEEKKKQQRRQLKPNPLTTNNDNDRVERGLNKMLGR